MDRGVGSDIRLHNGLRFHSWLRALKRKRYHQSLFMAPSFKVAGQYIVIACYGVRSTSRAACGCFENYSARKTCNKWKPCIFLNWHGPIYARLVLSISRYIVVELCRYTIPKKSVNGYAGIFRSLSQSFPSKFRTSLEIPSGYPREALSVHFI
jgi:hypothetical protein